MKYIETHVSSFEVDDDIHAALERSGVVYHNTLVVGAIAGPWDVEMLLDLAGDNTRADEREHYACSFVRWRDMVLLVRKNHPTWQSGRWNGIGGRQEQDEPIGQTAEREWLEETGLPVPELSEFLILEDRQVVVHFFRGTLSSDTFPHPDVVDWTNDRGESLVWHPLHVGTMPAWADPSRSIDNLCWLVPMAMSDLYHITGRVTAWRRGSSGEPTK